MPIPFVDGAGEVVFDIASVPLLDGTYPITLGIHSHDDGIVYDWSEQRHWFEVMNPEKTTAHGRAAGEGQGDRLSDPDARTRSISTS